MYLKDKFSKDYAVYHGLIGEFKIPGNKHNGYGYISRKTDSRGKKTFFHQEFYSFVYCLEGSSKYIDALSGKTYDIYPGCVVQRLPDVPHFTTLPPNSIWREFYIQESADIYRTLLNMNIAKEQPVFYIGTSERIHNKLIEYAETLDSLEQHKTSEILPKFTEVMMFIHSYKESDEQYNWAKEVTNIMLQNTNVNIPMTQIAKLCNLPYETMRKKFRKIFGCSPEKYRITLRMEQAKDLLLNKGLSVKNVAIELGYCDSYAFCKQFKQLEGLSPGIYVSKNKQI